MLIERYELELVSPPCEPGAERWAAFLRLHADIAAVLPYANAVWKGAIYDPSVPVLTAVRGGRRYSLRPFEVGISNVPDREAAEQLAERIVGELNGLWAQRDTVVPTTKTRRRPGVMEVYNLLPHTNCRECGEATCFVFATKLVAGQTEQSRCTRLDDPIYRSQRQELDSMPLG